MKGLALTAAFVLLLLCNLLGVLSLCSICGVVCQVFGYWKNVIQLIVGTAVAAVTLSALLPDGKASGVYSQCDILYYPKYILAWLWLSTRKLCTKQRAWRSDCGARFLERFGYVSSKMEEQLESPQELHGRQWQEEMTFVGHGGNEEIVYLSIIRQDDGRTSVTVLLELANGKKYVLPAYPKKTTCIGSPTKFKAGPLLFEYFEPMKRWRISFCGALKQLSKDSQGSPKLLFVRMHFVWSPLCRPFDYSVDPHAGLTASSLANEPWTPQLMSALCSKNIDGYEQWGMLQGEIILPDETLNVILRGPRTHVWEKRTARLHHHRSFRASIYMEDGTLLKLDATSDKQGLTECWDKSYIVQSNQWLRPIEKSSLKLRDIGEVDPWINSTASFTCTAGPRTHDVTLQVGLELFSSTSDFPECTKTIMTRISCTRAGFRGWGLATFTYTAAPKDSHESNKQWTLPVQISAPEWSIPAPDHKICVPFTANAAVLTSLVGGKGASLAALTRLQKLHPDENFKVARGFSVTAVGYQQQVKYCAGIADKLGQLDLGLFDVDQLKEWCQGVETEFVEAKLAPEIKYALIMTMETEFGPEWEQKSYALRSSGIDEDGDDASSAGQNETFLGIMGFENITRCLLKCWASQFGFRSVQYRRQNGIPVLTPMAVVVQEMVRAEAAGVLFTCDPVTGNPAFLHISANFGLGETVVSGEAEPDTIVLTRNELNDVVELLKVEVGQKRTQTFLNDGGKIVTIESPEGDQVCIQKEIATRLGKIGIFIESTMGGARDLEWALSDGDIYLLQSRPVTTIHTISEFEIKHEFDSGLLTDHEYSTRGNTGEVLPGAMTPLSLTSSCKTLDNTMQSLSANLCKYTMRSADGFCRSYHLNRLGVVSHSTVLLNIIELFMRDHKSREVQPDTTANIIGTFGRVFDGLDEMQRIADDRYTRMNKFQVFCRLVWFIQGLLRGKSFAKKALDLSEQLKLELDASSSPQEIEKGLVKAIDTLMQGGYLHINVSGLSLFAEVLMVVTLNGNKEKVEMSPQQISDVALLLGLQQEGVISKEVPETFRDLATLIRGTGKEEEFLSLTPKEADLWLREQGGTLGFRYKHFFDRHGHRGLREFELHSKPWGLAPELVAETLQGSVRIHSDDPVSKRDNITKTPDDIIKSLKTPLTAGNKRFLKLLISLGARGVRQREATKSAIIGIGHKLRLALRGVTQWLMARGRIPDDDLICFLTFDELLHLLQRPCPQSIQRALKRRRIHPILDALQFPEVVKGVPQPLPQEDHILESNPTGDLVLSGTPVCHGLVKGPIRVVKNLDEAKSIVPGDILVTHSTDIGWSPYFPILGGLVTEIGGLISHGAVVAREYGLPCVVGVRNATRYFEPGDVGVLDGLKGTLIRLPKVL